MKMTNRQITLVALSVAIVHFAITAVATRYIVAQIGTQMGQSVASFLADATHLTPDYSPKSVEEKYGDMMKRSEDIVAPWRASLFILSLPAKPLFDPLFKQYSRNQFERIRAKEITLEQGHRMAIAVGLIQTLLNSASLGLLLYVILRVVRHYNAP